MMTVSLALLKVNRPKGIFCQDGEVVLPVEGLGDPADGYGKDLGAELEGGGQHPQQRQQRDGGDEDQHHIEHRAAERVFLLSIMEVPSLHKVVELSLHTELEQRDGGYDEEKHHGRGGRAAVVPGDEGFVVDVLAEHGGGGAGARLRSA